MIILALQLVFYHLQGALNIAYRSESRQQEIHRIQALIALSETILEFSLSVGCHV